MNPMQPYHSISNGFQSMTGILVIVSLQLNSWTFVSRSVVVTSTPISINSDNRARNGSSILSMRNATTLSSSILLTISLDIWLTNWRMSRQRFFLKMKFDADVSKIRAQATLYEAEYLIVSALADSTSNGSTTSRYLNRDRRSKFEWFILPSKFDELRKYLSRRVNSETATNDEIISIVGDNLNRQKAYQSISWINRQDSKKVTDRRVEGEGTAFWVKQSRVREFRCLMWRQMSTFCYEC